MRHLLIACSLLGAGCLDLDHLMHLHDFSVDDAGVEDLNGVDQATGSVTWSGPVAGIAGPVNALHVVNGIAYLATQHGGVWSSPDENIWSFISPTLSPRDLNDVGVDDATTIYAADVTNVNGMGGIWKQTSGSTTWTQLVGSPVANVLVVTGSEPDATVYAGTSTGVMVSYDSGSTWAALVSSVDMSGEVGPNAVHALLLASMPGDPVVLYAGGGNGPYVYANHAWASAASGTPVPKTIAALTLLGTELYAGASPPVGMLYKTSIAPGSGQYAWTAVGLTPAPQGIQALANDGTNVYASSRNVGLYTVPPSGNPTVTTPAYEQAISTMVAIPASGSTQGALYAGGDYGFLFSSPASPILTVHNEGLHNAQITAITAVIGDQSTILAGSTAGQIIRSTNSGAFWNLTATGLPSVGQIHCITSDAVTSTRLYACTDAGVYTTTNSGAVFAPVGAIGQPPSGTVLAFAIDPTTDNTLYSGSADGVHKSTDGGASWTLLAGSPTSATALLVTKHALYVAGNLPTSVDGGMGLPTVMLSHDAGATFESADSGLPAVGIVQFLATGATVDTLYAATPNDGIYVSDDGAQTWTPSNKGLNDTQVTGLAFDPNTPLFIYASTMGGVFASADGAASWTSFGKGLGNNSVAGITLSNSVVLVGTNGDGVYYAQ